MPISSAGAASWTTGLPDGQLGQVAGSVNGEAGEIRSEAIQATIEVFLTATERDDEP